MPMGWVLVLVGLALGIHGGLALMESTRVAISVLEIVAGGCLLLYLVIITPNA